MILPAIIAGLATLHALQDPQTPPKAPPPNVKDAVVPAKVPLPPAPAQLEIPNAPLSVDEAARIALKLQPSLGDAQAALQIQQGRTRQLGAGMNPQVWVNGGLDRTESISGPTTPSTELASGLGPLGANPLYTWSTGAAIRQLIYDFNQTRNYVRQSEALEGVAAANLTRAQLDLIYSVKTAYYGYTNADRLVQVNEENVANRQRELDLAASRLTSGLGVPSDVVTAETSKSQAVLALTVARDTALQARVGLLLLMGVNPATPIKAIDTPEKPISYGGPQLLVETALRTRPEVQAAVQELQASRFGLSAAKALNLPAVYAAVAASDAGYSFPLKDNSLALAIGLQFPLDDGGARAGAIQQARGQIRSAESDLQSAMLAVRADVVSAYLSLASAEQRVAVVETEVANGREGVRVAEGRYAAGLGLFLDVITAQGLLLDALTDESTVKNNLDVARARLRHALGKNL